MIVYNDNKRWMLTFNELKGYIYLVIYLSFSFPVFETDAI